jgi:hypothetical protein
LSQGHYNDMAAWATLPEEEEQALQSLNQHNMLKHWQMGMEYQLGFGTSDTMGQTQIEDHGMGT